ncbi:MAG TPA: hypothetical protein VFM69_15730 [Pricia sp.]|nr:hypothetical protein [Pricia sp.]
MHQTATFRTKGLKGGRYWHSVVPFHYFIFGGIILELAKRQECMRSLQKVDLYFTDVFL